MLATTLQKQCRYVEMKHGEANTKCVFRGIISFCLVVDLSLQHFILAAYLPSCNGLGVPDTGLLGVDCELFPGVDSESLL